MFRSRADDGMRELFDTASRVKSEGWLDAERWSQTNSLAQAVRIYRRVTDAELPALQETLAAGRLTLDDVLDGSPEPGSAEDRLQKVAMHATTAVLYGMTLLSRAQPILVDPQLLLGLRSGPDANRETVRLDALPWPPYDVVYLDLASATSEVLVHSTSAAGKVFPGWTAPLYGAFVWRESDCLAMIPMRGLTRPNGSQEAEGMSSPPQGLFKVLFGPTRSLERIEPPNTIGISIETGNVMVGSRFGPGVEMELPTLTQTEQEALLACELTAELLGTLKLLEDRRVRLDGAAPMTMSTVDSGSVTPMIAHIDGVW